MKEQKVEVKEERGNRIFPVSDKSRDVLQAFYNKLKELNVEIKTNCEVIEILTTQNKGTDSILSASGVKGSI